MRTKRGHPVAQITDGQVQHQTTGGVSAIKQISDGQVQHQTNAAQPTLLLHQYNK